MISDFLVNNVNDYDSNMNSFEKRSSNCVKKNSPTKKLSEHYWVKKDSDVVDLD